VLKSSQLTSTVLDFIPQGLKPVDFVGFIGTTEVVPCYKATARLDNKTRLLGRHLQAMKSCSVTRQPGLSFFSTPLEAESPSSLPGGRAGWGFGL
jgi:hypothetical protein